MKIQISVSAENAAFLMATEKFKFKASFNCVAPNGLIVLDVYFSPLADSETIASSFFYAGMQCSIDQIKKKFLTMKTVYPPTPVKILTSG